MQNLMGGADTTVKACGLIETGNSFTMLGNERWRSTPGH
jgi:hypothetical protein